MEDSLLVLLCHVTERKYEVKVNTRGIMLRRLHLNLIRVLEILFLMGTICSLQGPEAPSCGYFFLLYIYCVFGPRYVFLHHHRQQ